MGAKVNMCRFCLEPTGDYLEIFGKNNKIDSNIAAVLAQHFWFEITVDDQLSKLICTKCWTNVDQFHMFFMHIQSVHLRTFGEFDNTFLNVEIKDQPQLNCDFDSIYVKEEPELLTNAGRGTQSQSKTNDDSLQEDQKHDESDTSSRASPAQKDTAKFRKHSYKVPHPADIKRAEEDARMHEFFNIECQECKLKCVKFLDLRAHYRKAHNNKRGYITCCNKKIKLIRCELLEHMCWHTNPNAFKCEICNKTYCDQYGLKVHRHHHTPAEEKIYTCDLCNKCYSIKKHLVQHLRQHFPKTHQCKQCEKTFRLNSVLQAHIRVTHENIKLHVCDVCAKPFKTKQQCQRHRQVHQETQKPLQCTICAAWLKNDRTLSIHVRRSHVEQPQACKVCGKSSPNKNALRTHMKKVHEDPRHMCSLCDKSFKKTTSLKDHMASHTGDILYTCAYCPETFSSYANKHLHRKKAHPEEWLRDRRHHTT